MRAQSEQSADQKSRWAENDQAIDAVVRASGFVALTGL